MAARYQAPSASSESAIVVASGGGGATAATETETTTAATMEYYRRLVEVHGVRRRALETDVRYHRARADASSDHAGQLEDLIRDMFRAQSNTVRRLSDIRVSLDKAQSAAEALRTERTLLQSECVMLRAVKASSDLIIGQFRNLVSEYRDSERSTMARVRDLEQRMSCSICLSARSNCLTAPCSHCATCRDCCNVLLSGANPRCPVCRAPCCASDVTTIMFA